MIIVSILQIEVTSCQSIPSHKYDKWKIHRIFSIQQPVDGHWRFLVPCRNPNRSCVELLPLKRGSVNKNNIFKFKRESGEITAWRNHTKMYLGITNCGSLTLHAVRAEIYKYPPRACLLVFPKYSVSPLYILYLL